MKKSFATPKEERNRREERAWNIQQFSTALNEAKVVTPGCLHCLSRSFAIAITQPTCVSLLHDLQDAPVRTLRSPEGLHEKLSFLLLLLTSWLFI